MLIITLV